MDDPDSLTFHTPEQEASRAPPPASAAASAAAAAAPLPSTDRKRARSPPTPRGVFNLLSSLTPSFRWRQKRERFSLDGMSGSAIRSANRTACDGSGDRDEPSDGTQGTGAKLEKLNLEKKFDDPSPSLAGDGNRSLDLISGSGAPAPPSPFQQQPGTVGGTQEIGVKLPAKKRVRLGEAMAMDGPAIEKATRFGGAATKSASIGGTVTFSSSPYRAFAGTAHGAPAKSPFASAASRAPVFHVGRATATTVSTRRRLTPGPNRSTRGKAAPRAAPPGWGVLTAGGKLARATPGRHPGPATRLRASGYRRRPINARSFRPMSRLLTNIYVPRDGAGDGIGGGAGGTRAGGRSTLLTDSVVSQILRENQNKLGVAAGGAVPAGGEEVEGARAVPRVRMQRVLGSRQTGGRRFGVLEAPALANSVVVAPKRTAATMGDAQLPPATIKLAAGANHASDAAAAPPPLQVPVAPYLAASLPPHGADTSLRLTPCRSEQDGISREVGEEIARLVDTASWRAAAECTDYGFGESVVTAPRRRGAGRERGSDTSHSMEATASDAKVPAVITKGEGTMPGDSGAPFDFMGAAALAAADGKRCASANDHKSLQLPPPPKETLPSATKASISSGWGNIFQAKPGEWKCNVCLTKNPKETGKCLACETPKPGGEEEAAAGPTPGHQAKDGKASIGAGGFSFGAASTTTGAGGAAAVATPGDQVSSGKASIGASGFSFGTASAATPGHGDKKSSVKGFSFGASPAAASKSTPNNGGSEDSSVTGSFTFGKAATKAGGVLTGAGTIPANAKCDRDDAAVKGTSGVPSGSLAAAAPPPFPSTTPANTPAKPKRGRDDDAAGGGFSFGTAKNLSGRFAFGTAASASSDEKKEDLVGSDKAVSKQGSFWASSSGTVAGTTSMAEKKETAAAESLNKKTTLPSGTRGTSSLPVIAENSNSPDPVRAPLFEPAEPSGKKAQFSFGAGKTASLPAPVGNDNRPASAKASSFGAAEPPSKKPLFSFGKGGTPSLPVPAGNGASPTTAPTGMTPFEFGATTPAATKKKDDAASSSKPLFAFGSTSLSKPAESAPPPSAAAPLQGVPSLASETGGPPFSFGGNSAESKPANAAFRFGAPASQVPPAFAFGAAGGAAPSTPAPAPANPPATSGAGFSFGATSSSTPAAPPLTGFGNGGFGATAPAPPTASGGFAFGNTSQTAAAPVVKALPGATFSFGDSSTPMVPTANGAVAPGPSTGSFVGFGNSVQPAPTAASGQGTSFSFGGSTAPPNPTSGFAPVAPSTHAPGFGGNAVFGATPSAMGGTTPAATGNAFSIGTGGPKRAPGAKRRIIKARRPPGTR